MTNFKIHRTCSQEQGLDQNKQNININNNRQAGLEV